MARTSVLVWLCAVCVWMVSGRVTDEEEAYRDYLLERLPPAYLEQLKELSYGPDDEFVDWSSEDEADAAPQFMEVPHWPESKARGLIGRQVAGVAMDTDNNLVVFHRGARVWDRTSFGMFNRFNPSLGPIDSDVLLTMEPNSGDVLDTFGAGMFYMPHGLTIDSDGNMWVTDVAMHQVMKIEKGSQTPSLTLGEKMVPGSDDTHFCKPTDVAVASNGDFFVADGYCNGRIMKFSANGTLLAKWGRPSGGRFNPGPFDLNIPHSLALDEARDLIMVADRENGRIQVYSAGLGNSTAGGFVRSYDPQRGTIYAIEYCSHDDVIYAVNGPGFPVIEGFTLDMRGDLKESWGPEYQRFGQPHDVTFSHEGSRVNVFVADIHSKQPLWRFVKDEPQPMKPMVG